MKNKLNFISKALLIKTIAVFMIIGMMDSQAFSQTRIRFARGKSSTTVSGTVAGGSSRSYVLNARRGQTILIRADSRGSVSVELDGVTDAAGLFTLNTTGDHTIVVYNNGSRSTSYTMYVEIR